jgi:phosphatidylinositol kinase/protein kinase (PI-3  family)
MHIRFKTRNIKGDISPRKFYDFLLKCDVNDITKEIKTFEIIDEINNIFKMKHYDTNESMSLKRYLIVPIAPTIILAEWLNDCISFSSVIEEQYKKDLIYQEEYKSIIDSQNNKPYIKPGSIVNEEEKFNVLYNYYQYNFFDPNLWYSAKKKYIISTAIWSMTQYLVGLGDRHPGNIMFNKKDGEVVHIDFGYVALKGLTLRVPEIVNFRLTFNLRKNLGLFEENGLFNYICVKTLKTFKEFYKTLSARIEYYQFDPLFDSSSDNKTFSLFYQNENFFNSIDDKNIKDKLKQLINKNTNPENLEKMYIWWSPWV